MININMVRTDGIEGLLEQFLHSAVLFNRENKTDERMNEQSAPILRPLYVGIVIMPL